MKCMVERNGRCDFANIADLVIDQADTTDHTFLRLSNARAVDILRNYMLLAGLRLESSTSSIKVARNRFVTAGDPNSGDISNRGSGNLVTGSGSEANLYVWDNVVPGP